MKRATIFALLLLLLAAAPLRPDDTLFGQAMTKLLAERFPGTNLSYLLLDTPTGELLAARWTEHERPAPLGSLVKPFTALAYARTHSVRYPAFTCKGEAGGCWHPKGHGRLGMTQAIAYSCNAYFRQLAGQLRPEQVKGVARSFGLPGLRPQAPATALVGLGTEWKVSPLAMARAYGRLARQPGEPGAAPLLRGMALSAAEGTGSEVGRALDGQPVLVKTGTAPCVHGAAWRSDGYVMILYPAASPRLTLLVRVHSAPGAGAAVTGGQILRTVVKGE